VTKQDHIRQEAERVAQLIFRNHEYLNAVDLIANALAAQKERDAKIAETFYNLTHGQQARIASMNISAAIRNQP
jgi:Ni,Fe-hydrogenase III large subunit